MTDPTPPPEPTMEDLRKRAGELEIAGRSILTKAELLDAIDKAEQAAAAAEQIAEHARQEAEQAAEGTSNVVSDDEIQPTPDHIVGRPPAVEVAEARAARREATMRVIGSPTDQED